MSSFPAIRRRASPPWAALALALLSACGKSQDPAAPPAPPAKKERPASVAGGEPAVVEVKHVLIAFKGIEGIEATRSREEAESLAYEVLGRARKGEEFETLMALSDDKPGQPSYVMTNDGIEPEPGETSRRRMIPAFGDLSFKMSVGEIGLIPYDPVSSPYGFHIVKRIR